jgi:iron complex transport system substrate-binding protein
MASELRNSPRRIVSLVASSTEIVCALGLADRLVGLDDFSDYPPEVQHLPRVGRDLEIDVERVATLEPDLVLASLTVPGMERNLPRLEAAGLHYEVVEVHGWSGLWESIRQIGRLCGVSREAEELTRELSRRASEVQRRLTGVPPVRVYWEWWPRPLITAGQPSWITTMLELAGGQNCFGDLEQESAVVDPELVRGRDPEAVILCYCGARKRPDVSGLAQRPGWQTLAAVHSGRLHAVLEPCFGRPGPRLVDGLEELAALLHPERAA